MDDYTRKSSTYRKNHLAAVKGLYGDVMDIPVKPLKKRKVKRKKAPPQEYILQVNLVAWAKYEGLDLISIPNSGKRSYWQGQKEVAMGLTKGVSDLFLCHPTDAYGGFWIELKRPGEKPKPEQYVWLEKMQQRGYMAAWYDNFDIARNAIMDYLNK